MTTSMLALTFAPALPADQRSRLIERARACLEVRDGEPVLITGETTALVVLRAGSGGYDGADELGHPTPKVGTERWPPSAHVSRRGEELVVSTDGLGLKQVAVTSGAGWAAISSSPMALGALTSAPLDDGAWGAIAFLGHPLGDASLFIGVARVAAHQDARLADGRVRIEPRPPLVPDLRSARGADVVRHVVGAALAYRPDAALELSGGLDSRVLLAGIPDGDRTGRLAITLGRDDDGDVVVARRIAARYGLDHLVVDPTVVPPDDPHLFLDEVVASAREAEFSADALSTHVFARLEAQLPQQPRLTGVAGELARGFYYPRRLPSSRVSRQRVERLASWRLFANHRADAGIFSPRWLAHQRESTIVRITESLQITGLPWHEATDAFYRTERLRNWAGFIHSSAAVRRTVLAPYTHPAYLAWAASLPTSQRVGSRALSTTLATLDPALGALRLAGDLSPRVLASRRPEDQIIRAGHLGGKVRRKVVQRLRDEGRPPVGTAALVTPVARALADTGAVATLEEAPFIDAAGLRAVLADPTTCSQPTAGLLVNLLGVQRYLAAVDRAVGHTGAA